MKTLFKYNSHPIAVAVLLIILILEGCGSSKKCCEGYTGRVTELHAIKLQSTCHFIISDSIVAWTARYQENKKKGFPELSPAALGSLLGDSTSFNSCIVKKIICHEKSIGMRVVYGMSVDRHIHVMLTGINADYSSLYIDEPLDCCAVGTSVAMAAPPPPGDNKRIGGAEYGQLP